MDFKISTKYDLLCELILSSFYDNDTKKQLMDYFLELFEKASMYDDLCK